MNTGHVIQIILRVVLIWAMAAAFSAFTAGCSFDVDSDGVKFSGGSGGSSGADGATDGGADGTDGGSSVCETKNDCEDFCMNKDQEPSPAGCCHWDGDDCGSNPKGCYCRLEQQMTEGACFPKGVFQDNWWAPVGIQGSYNKAPWTALAGIAIPGGKIRAAIDMVRAWYNRCPSKFHVRTIANHVVDGVCEDFDTHQVCGNSAPGGGKSCEPEENESNPDGMKRNVACDECPQSIVDFPSFCVSGKCIPTPILCKPLPFKTISCHGNDGDTQNDLQNIASCIRKGTEPDRIADMETNFGQSGEGYGISYGCAGVYAEAVCCFVEACATQCDLTNSNNNEILDNDECYDCVVNGDKWISCYQSFHNCINPDTTGSVTQTHWCVVEGM